jgi:RNA polymerase sigma-70 factor (ECF subfamily)
VDLRWAYADLLRGVQRKTGCAHRAYDVLHDSLVRFALAATREPIAQPHAYLRTVVGSVLNDRYRDDGRWVPLPDCEDWKGEARELAGYAPSSERVAQLRACLEATQRVFARLPARRREVFWLFRIDGLSCREIAGRLGLSVRTVENHVMRTMVDLRDAEELMI